MKKIKLFAMAMLALFTLQVYAYETPSGQVDVNVKVNNSGRFVKLVDGCYSFRGSSYSYSDGNGIKTQSSQGGVVFYLNGTTTIEVGIKHGESKNAHTVTASIYNLTEAEYKVLYDAPNDQKTSYTFSIETAASSFTIDIPAETSTFTGSTTLEAGYYALIASGEKSNTYFNYIKFTPASFPYPFVKSFTAAGVEAAVDTTNKTIVAELPYGTDRAAAIAGATVVMGGTAKTYSIAGDVLTAIDSVDTGKNINYDLSGIVVSENPSTDATLKAITVNEVALADFAADKYEYQMLAAGLPVVAAEANDISAKVDIEQAAANPGTATITVTAQDGETKLVYTIAFSSADKICGQLVKVTVASGKVGEITGNLPATADVSLSSSGKMDKGKYFGITLTQGAFREGDMFNIHTSTASSQGVLALYTDKTMATAVYTGENYGGVGDNIIILPAAADGLTTLYTARDANDAINKWNGVISFIEVTRDCEPKLMSFSLAGIDAVIDQDLLTVTAELPNGTVLTDNDWNNAYKLNAVATGAEYGAEHATLAVKGGEEDLVYTLAITISEEESENANLTEIKVNGNAIAGFRADSMAYVYELPFGTTDLAVIAATAEDITATVDIDEITANTQLVNILVTAQAGNTLTYSVQLAIASAPKNVTYVKMSNGMEAWQLDGDETIYAYYTAGETEPTISEVNVNEGASYNINGNIITVTGEDKTTKDYTVQIAAVSPVDFGTATITFDGTETWIKSGYGFDSSKKWRFSKTDSDNSREWAGKTRVYMFLPACDTISLTESTGNARNIFIYANGEQVYNDTPAKNSTYDVVVEQAAPFMLEIRSNQTGGDGGVGAIRMAKKSTDPTTALRDAMMNGNVEKFMMNNRLYIRRDNKIFDIMGHMMAK